MIVLKKKYFTLLKTKSEIKGLQLYVILIELLLSSLGWRSLLQRPIQIHLRLPYVAQHDASNPIASRQRPQ